MELPRLKWQKKAEEHFVAYPVGTGGQRYVSVKLANRSHQGLHSERLTESWHWLVTWEGWFAEYGYAESKQKAADQATEKWWIMVQTDLPRNIDLEAAMVAARVLVCPMPNSLLSDETAFLKKVLLHLTNIYHAEVKRHAVPAPVQEMMSRISAELAARLEREPEPLKIDSVAIGKAYRQRFNKKRS